MNETKIEPKNPKLGKNLYLQTFCIFCHKALSIGENVVIYTEDKKSCTKCGEKITENWFKEKKGKLNG